MSTAATTTDTATVAVERALVMGDLSKLSPDERVALYRRTCDSLGLNYYTQPFGYITLNGRLTLYALKTATDQLRKINGVSVYRLDRQTTEEGLHIVTAYVRDAAGREDQDVGAVNVRGLAGEALANAAMKATTKAKRRATLSICGLGWLDESEADSVPGARIVNVETGEIVPSASTPPRPAPRPQPAAPTTRPAVDRRSLLMIIRDALDNGWEQAEIQATMERLWQTRSTADLDAEQAAALIDILEGRSIVVDGVVVPAVQAAGQEAS